MASKRKSSDKNASQPAPELLSEAEQALRRLGNPDFDFDEVCLSETEREWIVQQLMEMRGSNSLDKLPYYTRERLALLLAKRLADTPQLQEAIERAEKLRECAERVREHAESVAKSVAATALAYDERASRHHVAELLRGPLSDEAMLDLCRELPASVEPMTNALFGYCAYRRSLAIFKKVLPEVRDKEPAEALAMVREHDQEVADWIEGIDPAVRQNFFLRLTQKRPPRKRTPPVSLQRNLALDVGAAVAGMEAELFENRVVNRKWPMGTSPEPRRRR